MPESGAPVVDAKSVRKDRANSQFFPLRRHRAVVAILLFSALYFTETIIRASEKRFWYDELCTLYICRLSSFHQAWAAVLHGADFNPPFFYFIQRASMHMWGSGQIGMRVPAILGFWTFSVCLFAILYRRVGVLGAWVGMTFLTTTDAYYYAYEARPHALVLGFCGLALLCWHNFEEEPASWKWLVPFALALEAAFLTHCYALLILAPFAAVELVRTLQTRRIRWQVWAALVLPAVIATPILILLIKSFKANVPQFAPPSVLGIKGAILFYEHFLRSSVPFLLLVLFAFGIQSSRTNHLQNTVSKADPKGRRENLLYLLFLGVPLYGILVAYATHGPFTPRYYLSGLAGVALLLGCGVGMRGRDWGGWVIAALLGFLLVRDVSFVIGHRALGWGENLIEPSSGLVLSTMPGEPLSSNTLLERTPQGVPIAIPYILDFLYLVQYWPDDAGRLYSVSYSSNSDSFKLNHNVREWCDLSFNKEETFSQFFAANNEFLLYGQSNYYSLLSDLIKQGAELRSLRFDKTNHFLADFRFAGLRKTGLEFTPVP